MKLPTKFHHEGDEYRIPDRKGGVLRCVASGTEEFEYVTVHGVGGWPSLSMLEHVALLFWPETPVFVDLKHKRLRFKVLLFARKDGLPEHSAPIG
jgi:hypothetical protein